MLVEAVHACLSKFIMVASVLGHTSWKNQIASTWHDREPWVCLYILSNCPDTQPVTSGLCLAVETDRRCCIKCSRLIDSLTRIYWAFDAHERSVATWKWMAYAKTLPSKRLSSSAVRTVSEQIHGTGPGVSGNFQEVGTVGAGMVAGVVLVHLQIAKARVTQILDIKRLGMCIWPTHILRHALIIPGLLITPQIAGPM